MRLSTVVDLREAHECEREPSALAATAGVDQHRIALWRMMTEAGHVPADPFDITAFYVGVLDHAGAGFAEAITVMASAPGATLFHCTAGKDRTGLLAALVLESVGVAREVVLEDYALTEARIGPIRERLSDEAAQRGVDRTAFARLLGATSDLLRPALDHLDSVHGGAVAYLQRHGVSVDTLATLRTRLASD